MPASAIRVEGMGKRYRLGERQRYYTLRDAITGLGRPSRRDAHAHIWALRHVSFEVPPGEVVGVIGRNGAGKTTLLRLLSRITEPTEGRGDIHGRVGSLLEVGTGFHPELSGRDNVFLNGAILGMKRAETAAKFDEIVAFAELDRFIDTPVKRYSSGMYARLAFAVAAHLDTEVLLIDEVLAVGDLSFQRKCLARIGRVAHEGRTVLFVSHNLGAVAAHCSRSIWIDQGEIVEDGPTGQVVEHYQRRHASDTAEWQRADEGADGRSFSFRAVRPTDRQGRRCPSFQGDQPIRIEIDYVVREALRECQVILDLENAHGVVVLISGDTDGAGVVGTPRGAGGYRSVIELPGRLLAPGQYSISVGATVLTHAVHDQQRNVMSFEVLATGSIEPTGRRRFGVVAPLLEWETTSAAAVA
jgi:lipopolysaccharide transport system ATP-binding protein